jgi:D-lyxose ketol-isomerase
MKKSEYIKAQKEAKKVLKEASIPLPKNAEIEIVDFGLGNFRKTGLALFVKVNEPEYCSKWMVVLPGQVCADHKHKDKKETFIVMKGIVELTTGNKKIVLKPGDSYTLIQNTYHTFTSKRGAVVEEVSTYDTNADNYFKDERIIRDPVLEK